MAVLDVIRTGRSYISYWDFGCACKQNSGCCADNSKILHKYCCKLCNRMSMLTKLINVVVIILSLTLGFFFMFVGILKLTPVVNEDTHEEMVSIIIRSG